MYKKIVIIGAGPSGIAAGTKLMDNGFRNILILEAENRIGGRINTVPYGANVVDMGAQWCHGEKNNAVFGLANKHNLLQSNTAKYNSFQYYQSNGTEVSAEISDKLLELFMSIMEECTDDMKTYEGSLGTFVIEKFNKELQNDKYKHIDPILSQQFLECFHKYENSLEASDTWFDTSCKSYCEYWDCEGDRLLNWKDKGYVTVFELLKKNIPASIDHIPIENNIQFNKEVTKVIWKHGNEYSATIHCSDGSVYDAEHVIVTVSLGVLKERYLSMFEPPLPANKVNAIKGISFGTVDKIYIEFEKPFWPINWRGFSVLWNIEDLQGIRRLRDNWLEDVYGFYIIDYQPNILCGWVSGANARRMEIVSDEDVRKGVMLLLRLFLKNFTIPDPISIKRSQWHRNPHFRGSYSFKSLDSDLLNATSAELAEPITDSHGKPVVQFAGEASHDHYYSTVHGAIETGWREAERIINLYINDIGDMKIKNPNGRSAKDGTTTKFVDVLVLGAGLAGLGAATKLKKSKFTFLVLEGQDKAGGRVNTMELIPFNQSNNQKLNSSYKKIDNEINEIKSKIDINQNPSGHQSVIDSGAQWLHGKYNYLHEVAEKHDLLSSEQSEEGLGVYMREDGYKLDDYFVKKIDFRIGQILEECEQYARNNNTSYPKSVKSFLIENFNKHLDTIDNPEEKTVAKQLLDWHIRFQVIDNSCLSLDNVSAKYWGQYSYNGESCQAHYNFKNGFSSAADALLKDLDENNFVFNKEVTEISIDYNKPRVSVKCSDQTIYQANHVIVTFSIGILKTGLDTMFKPLLPELVAQTIRDIGFETINKLFFQFDHAWWGDVDGIQLVFSDENYENNNWTRHITGFDVMNPGPANTLLAWVGGNGAIEMEKLSDNQIIHDCITLLAQFTNIYVPAPIKYYCTRWHTNRFIRGAYSYTSTECDKHGTSSRLLVEPITLKDFGLTDAVSTQFAQNLNKFELLHLDEKQNNFNQLLATSIESLDHLPVLLFAGEACHEQYFSTAHGAFLSGIEQAEKILQFYN